MKNPSKEPADDGEAFRAYGEQLLDAVSAAIRPWISSTIRQRVAGTGSEFESLIESVAVAVERSITELVAADVDAPLSGPLERIRQSVRPISEAFDAAGVERPHRDPVEMQMRPDDPYGLGPMTFRDLSEEVHVAGITWGAAKAHLHLQRHRGPGTPERPTSA